MGLFDRFKSSEPPLKLSSDKLELDCTGMDERAVVTMVVRSVRAARDHGRERVKFAVTFDEHRIDPQMLAMNIMMNVNGCGPAFWNAGESLDFTVEF